MKALCAPIFAALLLGACAAGSGPRIEERSPGREIADNAVAFNEAYGQAVAGQILLNIMRSRDRMPRYYLSMTGIADNPSRRYEENAGIGGIPLGGAIGTPWGRSARNWRSVACGKIR